MLIDWLGYVAESTPESLIQSTPPLLYSDVMYLA